MNNQGILLDTGTNEVEILELMIHGQCYGINVLKIRQLVKYEAETITPVHLPGIHAAIMGTMIFHGKPIAVIDLRSYLGPSDSARENETQVIAVCEFNNAMHGFRVDAFDSIHRISWGDIQVPDFGLDVSPMITGVCSTKNWEIMLLDFEGIISDVIGTDRSNRAGLQGAEPVDAIRSEQRQQVRILVADDSPTIRQQLKQRLTAAGYLNLTIVSNGEEAYEKVQALKSKASAEGAELGNYLDIVVTDIEMPRMDGLTLCRRLKTEVPDLSVVILSSMISDQMAQKCKLVSADAYLSKMESQKIISVLDELCLAAAPGLEGAAA